MPTQEKFQEQTNNLILKALLLTEALYFKALSIFSKGK